MPTFHYLPAKSDVWAGLLPQFVLSVAAKENRAYANWAGDRLLRVISKNEAVVALDDGCLLGFLLYEIESEVAELSFPWLAAPDLPLAEDLTNAALQTIREGHAPRYIRLERQFIGTDYETLAVEAAGFICHWRLRMSLELVDWSDAASLPAGYHLAPWNIHYLDAAAEVIYAANAGTLDAKLYAPFFGDSSAECRKGILSILAGRYGPLHPKATLCAFHGTELVGVNLVINSDVDYASVIEISVTPSHQGNGLGRLLMIHSLRELQYDRLTRAELAVTAQNTRALALYESLGFTVVNRFPVCIWPR